MRAFLSLRGAQSEASATKQSKILLMREILRKVTKFAESENSPKTQNLRLF
ncbi:hypothetical protein ACWIUD_03670 [Helicobacter sp. 23-1044]